MSAQSKRVLRWAGVWTLVFALNLPLAAVLSNAGTRGREAADTGVLAGAWLLWAGWLVAGAWRPRLRPALTSGGIVAVAAQGVALGHIIAGILACAVATDVFGALRTDTPAPVAFGWGMSATVVTGNLVLLPALGLGLVLTRGTGHRHPPPDPDEDAE